MMDSEVVWKNDSAKVQRVERSFDVAGQGRTIYTIAIKEANPFGVQWIAQPGHFKTKEDAIERAKELT